MFRLGLSVSTQGEELGGGQCSTILPRSLIKNLALWPRPGGVEELFLPLPMKLRKAFSPKGLILMKARGVAQVLK